MLEPVETETWQEKPGDDPAPFPAAPDPAAADPAAADPGARSRGATRLLVVAPVIAAAMVVAVLVAASARTLAIAGQVPGGTRVAGVEIGGLSPKVAEARLYKELADDAERPIKVTAAGQRFTVAATEAGLALDAKATVAATGHSGLPSPADLLRPWFGARDVEPRLKVEQAKLAAVVDGIAKQVDKPPREGGIRYSGTRPVVVKPKPGTGIDRAKTRQAIRDAFLDPQPSVTVAAGPVQPSVSLAKANEIARTTAREAVAAPLRLTNAGRSVSVPPSAIARGLKFVPDGKGSLRPQFNAKDVAKTAEKAFVSAAQAPRNATFDVKGGRLELVPARTGKGVDAGKLGEAITKVLAAGGTRTVPVSVVTTPPSITDQQARAMGIKEKISSFTTQHPCCAPRVTNIQTIARILDGHIVKPGETFSLNRIVGQRDRARGFVPAPMILNGRFVDDVGGGISQFVTTMFNAVFFAGLQNVQHTPHSFYISRYPAGRESTVSYPEPDFRWRNDSPHGVLVKTSYTGTSITVDFWGTKRYDIESQSSPKYAIKKYEEITESGDKCTPMPGADGFSIDVYRIFKKDGRVVRRQKFHTVYLPEPKLTCKPKAEDRPGGD